MYSKKITRNWKTTKLDLFEIPPVFMQTSAQLKQSDKGLYKLRARNEKIYAELLDLAQDTGSKLIVTKGKNKVYYTVRSLGITVCLDNNQ